MAKKAKKNPYEGKVEWTIGGQPVEELGEMYFNAVVIDWFIRSMYRIKQDDPEYAWLKQWEYLGIDFEKYRKQPESEESDALHI